MKEPAKDNTEDNLGGNAEDSMGDNSGGNTGDNTEDNSDENTENNTGDNSGGDAEGNTEENVGDNTEDNSGGNAEDNVGDDTGDNSGGNAEDNVGDDTGDNSDENTENNTEENAKEITLTFSADGGIFASTNTSDKTLVGKYGDAIPLAALGELSKTGYTFAGWNPSVPETFPAENATYTAQWTRNTANITITLPSNPSEIGELTYEEIDENNIKFTAASGHTTYTWWVDGSKTDSTENTFTLETTSLKEGTHSVMVIVDGLYSSIITVVVTK